MFVHFEQGIEIMHVEVASYSQTLPIRSGLSSGKSNKVCLPFSLSLAF